QVAGRLKLDYAQYRELAAFAQFGSDMDKATRTQLDRGARITEIFKQLQYGPVTVEDQIAIIWAVTNGMLDDIPVARIREFESGFTRFLGSSYPELVQAIGTGKALSDETTAGLTKAIGEFKMTQTW
ncbi:MAG TPA: F0F1 ATP synthase subunit alpha, partial [Chloroflexota bacterium]|nr:F0F1 ATP synthase subunit alpha [Chloroflexota bacterium]